MRERGVITVVGSVCVYACVCLSVRGKLGSTFAYASHLYTYSIYMTNARFKRVDFAKIARVESYDDKYLSRRSYRPSLWQLVLESTSR